MVFILIVVLTAGFFTGGSTPAFIKYAPELCGMAVSAYILVTAVRQGFSKIAFVYWVLIGLIALHLLFGIIANEVKPGTVIIGGRMYLRTIPFFLLALTITPNATALKTQFYAILAVALLQLPISVYQKISNYQRALTEGYVTTTGDWVTGTLTHSGFLSIFLICVLAVIVTLYAKKKIGLITTVVLSVLVLIPTLINETKATFFLAPFAIAIPLIFSARENRIKNLVKTVALLTGFVGLFVPTYDHFVQPRWGYGFLDFLTMEGRLEGYLVKDAEVGTTGNVGRIDSFSVAADVLGKDPSTAAFGFGIGGVTESSFGKQYEGKYFSRYGIFAGTTYARLFWEIGFLGTIFVMLMLYLIFSDARKLCSRNDAHGLLALSYLAIIPIILVAMFYKNLLLSPALGICFWYYCGVISAASQWPPPEQADIAGTTEKNGRLNPAGTVGASRRRAHQ